MDEINAAIGRLLATAREAQDTIDDDTDLPNFCVVPNHVVQRMIAAAHEVAERAVTNPPYVRKFLDLSTAHLPKEVCDRLDTYSGVRAYETDYGWMVYAPDNPAEHAAAEREARCSVPDELIPIWQFARDHGCAYVMFDQDGDLLDDLPQWDW